MARRVVVLAARHLAVVDSVDSVDKAVALVASVDKVDEVPVAKVASAAVVVPVEARVAVAVEEWAVVARVEEAEDAAGDNPRRSNRTPQEAPIFLTTGTWMSLRPLPLRFTILRTIL